MNKNIKLTAFSSAKGLPNPAENLDKREGIIRWGAKNDFPFFLIDMFNGSAWHQGIIKTKTHYVAGGGVEIVNGSLDDFIENKNSDFTINDIAKKIAFDFELFEGFAIVGTWNREGTRVSRWEHIDIDKIRANPTETEYFFSEDWNARKQSYESTGHRSMKPLDRTNPVGKFIIYYKSPAKQSRGEMGIYPKPAYIGGLTSINTDVLISQYHLFEIQNGFKGGTIVSLNTGQPETTEEAEAYRDEIKGSSTDISDSNQLIITFADGQENAPTVLSLNGNDLADRYNMTEKSVQQNILVCHSATNPLMFGIKTEGQLGGSTELLESFEIFKNTYVNSRQETIEYFLNLMVDLSGFVGTVELAEAAPIGKPETIQPEIMIEQFRSSEKDLKVFSNHGANRNDFTVIRSIPVHNEFGSSDVEKMEGNNFGMFFDKIGDIRATLTDIDKNVLELLKRGEDGASIVKAVDAPLSEVAKSISKLESLNLLVDSGTSKLGEKVLDGLEIEVDQYEVRYSYEVKPGLGAEVISTSRDFCKELIRQDRMYLRTELNTISGAIGRDVWRYRGGFYHNKTTDRTTPWCRHEWVHRTTPWCRHEWVQHLVVKN
jgi:hypothetical protein